MITVIFAAATVIAAAAAFPSGAALTGPPRSQYVDDAVLVSFAGGVPDSVRRADRVSVGATVVRQFIGGTELLRVPRGAVTATITHLRSRGHVRFAEPDYVMHEDGVPNDPSFGLQWGYQNTGQTVNGTAGTVGADEHAVPAWGVTTGSRSVVVGEVDSGVDYNHPDLSANVWSNPGGVGGCAAGTHGYNVLTDLCDPLDDETVYGGHGTHVAGIIGAVGNNGRGVTGVNWTTTILPVKWLDSSGGGTTSGLISALNWLLEAQAAGVNIRVVNDSATWKGDAYSQALADEIDLLGQHDILFVTAAGNTGDNNDTLSLRRYPCGYDRPTEICVTASNQQDGLPSWANYGPTTVDLAAPGNNIYSTLRNGTYGYVSGGSMASPQVAGTAALILSTGYMSAADLKADILANVDPVPALSGLVRTGGRLDICKALPGCAAAAPPANTALPVVSGTAQEGQTLSASTGSWTNSPTGYAYQWLRCVSGSCSSVAGATGSSYHVVSADVGDTLEVAVTATNGGGSAVATSSPTASVQSAPAGSATFGTTTVGGRSDAMLPDRKRVNRYQLSVAGSVTKLSIYLQSTGTSGTQVIKGVLYADSAGKPGALVATTSELSFSSSQSAGWYDMAFPSPVALGAGNYWIGMISGTSSHVAGFRYTSVAGSRAYNANSYASGPTNPFGTPTIDDEQMSEYATYTTGASSPPAPPANTALPVVSGTAQEGQTLSASTGSWTNSPTGYAYQWLRCVSGSCSSVAGATGSSYHVVSADVGDTLEVAVTATNGGGSAVATSSPTASVQSAPAGSATFGTTTVGGRSDAMLPDRKRVNRYQLSVAGSVTKLSIYLQSTGTSGTQVIKGVLYADSAGKPGALVATTSELSFSSSQSAGWYDMAFPSPVALGAGNYWIGMISGTSSHVAGFRYTSVAGSRAYNANSYASGPTNPFGTPTIDDEQMSEYATYTSGA
jgi:subtilisin family serine protease